MDKQIEVINLAQERVDKVLQGYVGISNEESVLLAAIELNDLLQGLFGQKITVTPQITSMTLDFLRKFEVNDQPESGDTYSARYDLALVRRAALVGLAAAAIGASTGLMGQDIHPVLIGVVGAQAAVILNVLSALLTDNDVRKDKVDGLDLAVLSVLQEGHYTPEEVASRISASLDVTEVRASIRKLVKMELVKTGRRKKTFTTAR
jgi:hypothetical protein